MILGVIFSLTGIGLLIALMFNMAIYALPLFSAVTAGRLAYANGAGWLGAILVGLLAGLLTLGVGQLILGVTRSNLVRLVIAVTFAAPAAFAGYHVVPRPLPHRRRARALADGVRGYRRGDRRRRRPHAAGDAGRRAAARPAPGMTARPRSTRASTQSLPRKMIHTLAAPETPTRPPAWSRAGA